MVKRRKTAQLRATESNELNIKNRTIFEGDNLDILRGFNDACVDLVYLDPPFNSNKNYAAPIGSAAAGAAFKDTWHKSDVDDAWVGEIADREPGLVAVIKAAELAHSDSMSSYLTMMGVRLLELRRVLKPTGSIYLHCDDTAGAYLRMVMDAIFGRKNYRNEIVWKRQSANNATKKGYGRILDYVLFYTMSEEATWNQVYQEFSKTQLARFRHRNKDGRLYKTDNLTAPSPSPNRMFEWRGTMPGNRGWRYSLEKLEELWANGLIHTTKDGRPRLDGHIKYLDEMPPGQKCQSLWTDIPRVGNTSKERKGYPTQKSLALLERIIKASSNPGDVVLDPFCGCATTCVAAESLGREWVGMDLSGLAIKLVRDRLRDELGMFGQVIHLTKPPRRTDLGDIPDYSTHKHTLYGQQEGHCKGCKIHFPFRNLTIDHIIPESKGGSDHRDNLQLLCGACNSLKGDREQAWLLAELKKRNII